MKNKTLIINLVIMAMLVLCLVLIGFDINSLLDLSNKHQICYRVIPDNDITSSEIIRKASESKTVLSISACKEIITDAESLVLYSEIFGDTVINALSGRIVFSDKEISDKACVLSVPTYSDAEVGSVIQIMDKSFSVIGRNTSQNYFSVPITTFEEMNTRADYYIVRCSSRFRGIAEILSRIDLQIIMGSNKAEIFIGKDGSLWPRSIIIVFLLLLPLLFLFFHKHNILDFKTCKAFFVVLLSIFSIISAGSFISQTIRGIDLIIKYSQAESCYKRLGPKAVYYMTDWTLSMGNKFESDELYKSVKEECNEILEIRTYRLRESGTKIMLLDDALIDAFLKEKPDNIFSQCGVDDDGEIEAICFDNKEAGKKTEGITVKMAMRFSCLPSLNANKTDLTILDIASFDKTWLVGKKTEDTLKLLSNKQEEKIEFNYLIIKIKDTETTGSNTVYKYGSLWSLRDALEQSKKEIIQLFLKIAFVFLFSVLYLSSCGLVLKKHFCKSRKR